MLLKERIKQLLNKPIQGEMTDAITQIEAINKVMGVISFKPDGTILGLNENFASAVGYSPQEVIGQHHHMFVDSTYAQSDEYRQFWEKLASGQFHQGEYKRLAKGNQEIWIQASYNPIVDRQGNVIKVVKYATDITANKLREAEVNGLLNAINNIQGVIEFDLTGKILAVNDNFVAVTGYSKSEIVGQHHSMFVEPSYQSSTEYKNFWVNLSKGQPNAGRFKRVGKNGKEIWLEASYNPIFDMNGKPFKVVKYATDITESMKSNANFQGQLKAINAAQAVIEFTLTGEILRVNQNFVNTMGYSEQEIIGKHHRIFMDATEAESAEYQAFWEALANGHSKSGRFKRFGKGQKQIWLQGYYSPINNSNDQPYKVVKYANDISEIVKNEAIKQQTAIESVKIKSMIESASTNMMMADNDGTITYMNPSTQVLMHESANKFREVLPHFDPDKIIGSNFDIFHKSPSHQRNLLAQLTKPYETTIPVSGLFFKLKASPIYMPDGSRLGTSLEWVNVTAERSAELEITKIVDAAGQGDLSSRLRLDDKVGAVATICSGINSLIDNMVNVISQVQAAGETINTAANEIASGNNNLSSRTEQQASSLEETASSMEELASTVKQNAENAKQANQLASAASGVAVKGGKVVGNVVTTMADINESARKIEDIISVIDGIAFQTNILALNAAVEAARAGEQGRGFAVVAGEVRNLAQRSSSAAKEIKDLISDSVGKVQEGTKLVEDAGSTMAEIVSSVQRVTDIMGEITVASQEQSAGIDQVNHAITSMDEVTQQNAALVEEAAAAAESLVEQANSLMETVSAFQLNRTNAKISRSPAVNSAVIKPKASKTETAKPSNQDHSERRAPNSPMRNGASDTPAVAKTGTSDDDWEEF